MASVPCFTANLVELNNFGSSLKSLSSLNSPKSGFREIGTGKVLQPNVGLKNTKIKQKDDPHLQYNAFAKNYKV